MCGGLKTFKRNVRTTLYSFTAGIKISHTRAKHA